jgi:DNA-binding response OmpR family regulator
MNTKSIEKVLLVEDNPGDARLIREIFSEQFLGNSELTHVECMKDAEMHLSGHSVDLVLLDLGLPDSEGLGAIRRVHAAAPEVPVVVMTGLDDDAVMAQALHEGAQNYFVKSRIETRGLSRPLHYDAFLKRIMKW